MKTLIAATIFTLMAGTAFAGEWTQPTTKSEPCTVWNPLPQPNETVIWDSTCVDGKADGYGILEYRITNKSNLFIQSYKGSVVQGRLQGAGTLTEPDGSSTSGYFEDGQLKNGEVIMRDGKGRSQKVFLKDGKPLQGS